MDRGDVESGHRLHEGQRRLQKLLCGAARLASPCDGKSEIHKRLSTDTARRRCRSSKIVANSADDFCKLHERSFSPGGAAWIHPAGLRDNESVFPPHVSNSNQAKRSLARTCIETA